MATTTNTKARTYISWLTISFMMVAAVASIRSLPAMAVYGLGSIMLFLIPAVLFFIPVALVASELGTGWNGGIYGWVKQAYGDRLGFFAIWFLWIEVVVWYPSVLGFAASTLAYMFNPALANNGLFTCIVIIVFTGHRHFWPCEAWYTGQLFQMVHVAGYRPACGRTDHPRHYLAGNGKSFSRSPDMECADPVRFPRTRTGRYKPSPA